ncbi:YdbL family protein [Shewanella aestuarii]|uniref:YdbL family protein n=1 Tax=Shewanella aestuarii TaxID=1028752 RepID=A0A6G9QLM3_9GAMM|nr:YdbL family protein [Shewanella aestuarii]QIR14759.1 YdbL family protein [Shewanella aestuarii]
MKHSLSVLVLCGLFVSILLSTDVHAITLQQAKSTAVVGEQTNGYLGIIKPSVEVEALVKDVNSKRQQHYQRIAQKNGISTEDVAKLAAEKAIAAADKGHAYQNKQGEWQIK